MTWLAEPKSNKVKDSYSPVNMERQGAQLPKDESSVDEWFFNETTVF